MLYAGNEYNIINQLYFSKKKVSLNLRWAGLIVCIRPELLLLFFPVASASRGKDMPELGAAWWASQRELRPSSCVLAAASQVLTQLRQSEELARSEGLGRKDKGASNDLPRMSWQAPRVYCHASRWVFGARPRAAVLAAAGFPSFSKPCVLCTPGCVR